MQTYLTNFIAATLASALLTPVARALAFRFNIVSTPGGRHVNGRNVPRLGGLAIFAGTVSTFGSIGMLGLLAEPLPGSEIWRATGLLASGSMMFGLGLWDDIKGLRAGHKMAIQALAAAVAWGFGFRMDIIELPFVGEFGIGWLSLPVTVLWIVGIINAINLIDGLDGLAAGVVFFAGVTNFVVASMMGTTFVAVVMATLTGAVLGFLFFNFNPARIFMGDSGSYFLGFVLAVCSIAGPLQKASAAVSIMVPLVALGVPIIDTLLAMVRRVLEHRPIFSPDRGHIHHRLLDMGITHRRAVLIIYGVSVALCVGAIGIALGRSWQVGAAILGVSAVLFGLIRFIGYFEYLIVISRQKQRIRSRHVEWLRKCVLRVSRQLEGATEEEAVWNVLSWLAREARLDFVELLQEHGRTWTSLRRWAGDDYQDMDVRDASTARFPLGNPARGHHLKFGWRSEFGDVPPQMEILLQLVVDQIDSALRAVKSEVAQVEESRAEEAEATPQPSTVSPVVSVAHRL